MLGPTATERAARARTDLRLGLPIAVGPLVLAAAETLRGERLEALRALGPLTIALTGRRAATLKARAYDGDIARVRVPEGADMTWLRALADPAFDLRVPMKGPLTTLRAGDPTPWRTGIALAKAAQVLPAVIGVEAEAPEGLTRLPATLPYAEVPPTEVAAARLPMLAGAGRLHVFREGRGGEEHYAVEIGAVDRAEPVLVRLHSACFTGDVLGSLKCDCGPQLHGALDAMGAASGVLLYLNQEGRGIGLANKMRAYDLQDQGFDTVEANHRLGFEDDERDFRLGAALLRRMGITRIRLMTNNPRKIAMMEGQGIEVVERVPLHVGRRAENAAYLDVKRTKSGHLE
ncbi:GTP cyclohydrolase II [Jannaschia seohaensis]|uniref:GTP cyclohydrolase-2 n=1 Tax=Jannaschia seohaensis TaxID=475081 RepID=A0A2Y9A527_9RHOB|nr:GTP cyclohydrolase II [Jannaschia seohaensis]PWJ22280.1 GTP cyclohydrolase II [Jannaschia seohaensis]SSA38558.1 GTP cyclohydrolase II [Jannaschia seohaensis]